MNIYKFEFRKYIKSVIIWTGSIVGLLIMFMSFYPSFGADAELMEKLMANYPEELLKAFGMSSGLPLSTIAGYFVFVFAFIQLCIGIQAANYGFALLSVEERELTADFLMSKPVSRVKILLTKFLAALTALTITNIGAWIGTFAAIELFRDGKDYEADQYVLVLSSIIIFQLFFLSVGMVISVCLKKIRSVLSFSMALACGLYVLNALRSVVGGEVLGVISPYYHFEAGYMLEQGKYNIGMAIISVGVIVASLVSTYFLYTKRNIHSL